MSTTTHRTPNTETFLSLTILGCLVAISLVFLTSQSRLNPALENYAPKSDGGPTSSLDIMTDDVSISLPAGISVMSPAERFTPDTLSNKINGKAELYLSAGFVSLHTQRFRAEDDSSTWFEVYIYDMGSPSNAFAVFSSQRRRDVEKLNLTHYAYGTSNALFFTAGQHYVEMIAATAGDTITSILAAFAENYLAQVNGESATQEDTADPKRGFPTEGLMADSITLIAKDAFGFNLFDQVYTARYQGAETETTLFVSLRPSSQEADMLAAAYRNFLIEFGGIETAKPEGLTPEGFFALEIMDAYVMVFSKGPYLAGVHMAEDKDAANRLTVLLVQQLERSLVPEEHKKEAVE